MAGAQSGRGRRRRIASVTTLVIAAIISGANLPSVVEGRVVANLESAFGGMSRRTTDLQRRQEDGSYLKLCRAHAFQSTRINERIFMDGGKWFDENNSEDAPENSEADMETVLGGYLYYIHLGQSFELNKATTGVVDYVFHNISKGPLEVPVLHGSLLANNAGFVQYGGVLVKTNSLDLTRDKDQVVRYEVRKTYTESTAPWKEGYAEGKAPLGPDVTNYVAMGSYVNVPSENLGFYFSGVENKDGSEFGYLIDPVDSLSSSLIIADLADQRKPSFRKVEIDIKKVPARALSHMVWIPIGTKGSLVVVGGVPQHDIPGELLPPIGADEPTVAEVKKRKERAHALLKNVGVYDIAKDEWHTQSTTGPDFDKLPDSGITGGCAVVASAQDGSSHNIYIYGGMNGVEAGADSFIYGTIWVLSLPSFKWIRVYTTVNGRKLHHCHRVSPDQMMIIGGVRVDEATCSAGGGLIQLYNLNTNSFEDKYDPLIYSEYKVPSKVSSEIGGDAEGGETEQSPENGWDETPLGALFKVKYSKELPTHSGYPNYVRPTDSINTPEAPIPIPPITDGNQSGTSTSSPAFPKYIPPLIGTLLGLLVLITLLAGILYFLRRRKRRQNPTPSVTEGSTVRRQKQTWSWLMGVSGDEKRIPMADGYDPRTEAYPPSNSDSNAGVSSGMTHTQGLRGGEARDSTVLSPVSAVTSPGTEGADPMEFVGRRQVVVELGGKVIHELGDTSRRPEPQELDSYSSTLHSGRDFKAPLAENSTTMTATTTSTTAAGYPLDTKEDPVLVPISIQARQALPVGNARPRHQDNGIIEDDMEISTVVPGQGLPRYEA